MKRYKSKIDFWLIFILILGSIILLQEIYITFQSYTLYQNLPYLVIYSLIFLFNMATYNNYLLCCRSAFFKSV